MSITVYTWPKHIDLHAISAYKALHPKNPYLLGLYRLQLKQFDKSLCDIGNTPAQLMAYIATQPGIINPNNTAYSLTIPNFLTHKTGDMHWLISEPLWPIHSRQGIKTTVGWGIHVTANTPRDTVIHNIVRSDQQGLLINPISDRYEMTPL